MSYETIRDAIVARLSTVPNIGIVSSYRRSITTWDAFETAFMTTVAGQVQIRAVDVAWESGTYMPMGWTDTGQRMRGPQVYVVRGYMALRDGDATDREFSALIDSVIEALTTAGATIVPKQAWTPVELRTNGFMELGAPGAGGALIHHCEIAVTLEDEKVVT